MEPIEINDSFTLDTEITSGTFLKKSFSINVKSRPPVNDTQFIERNRSNSLFQFAIRPQDVPHPKPKKADVCPSPMNLRLSGKLPESISNEDCLTDTDSDDDDEHIASNETRKLRNSLKKEFKETLIEVNDRKTSNEYENILSSEKSNFTLESEPRPKRFSFWRKYIRQDKENVSLRHTISNAGNSSSILRILESSANDIDINRLRCESINYK